MFAQFNNDTEKENYDENEESTTAHIRPLRKFTRSLIKSDLNFKKRDRPLTPFAHNIHSSSNDVSVASTPLRFKRPRSSNRNSAISTAGITSTALDRLLSFSGFNAMPTPDRVPSMKPRGIPRQNSMPQLHSSSASISSPTKTALKLSKSSHDLFDLRSSSKKEKVNIILVGDSHCGKTSLIMSYMNIKPDKGVNVSSVIETYTKETQFSIPINHTVKCVLWDVPGHEDYDRIRPLMYADADIALLCFDIGSIDSLINVIERWSPEVATYCPGIPTVLVGLKSDLRKKSNDVSFNDFPEVDLSTIANISGISLKPNNSGPKVIRHETGVESFKQINASNYMECSSIDKFGVESVMLEALKLELKLRYPNIAFGKTIAPAAGESSTNDEDTSMKYKAAKIAMSKNQNITNCQRVSSFSRMPPMSSSSARRKGCTIV